MANTDLLFCSVCEKSQQEVQYLLTGERMNICDACVAECNRLIEKRKMKELFQMPIANDPEY